ncbi:DEAD/DEAH box helicase [Intestinibacter bartlettii]|uniref:DEAD/DEAH box helicase n=1 Tax=Intestinibacter bartlettii TaxID=261299 RepID=A0ABS6DYQ8_9FIRM|nr:DEAD/DEAH box helicase [Intestinibacter bartlettii]MBU5336986.1 DEAD/DEAH box helicase [Intestinibacter bartlettii]
MKGFNKFNLDKDILKSLNILDYKTPSKVQEEVIPVLIDRNNILVKSKTGTGKSASFAIPICNQIKPLERTLKALIIVPTRELALQVKEEIEKIGRIKKVKCSMISGKEPLNNQILELKQGANVVVATPGRMIDHISRKSIDLSNLDYFVIDEVDKMFTKGFKADIDTIIKSVPKIACKAFFSATVENDLKDICEEYMTNYKYIEVKESEEILKNEIVQQYIKVNNLDTLIEKDSKYENLKKLLYKYKPETAIIFANTKRNAEILCKDMKRDGFLAEQIHGDISQERRFFIIDAFKKHEFNILISSDIISRGIHIDDVSLVVNYDIPMDEEVYVHRIGRTGRAGKKGIAVSLVSASENKSFEDIQNYIKHEIDSIDIKCTEKDKEDYELKVKDIKEKGSLLEFQQEDEFSGEVTKIHINLGKKKKIRIGDIVGALNNIENIENEDLGVIKIYDNYSTVDILNKKGIPFLNEYSEIIVKNKKAKVREEK